jgi:hypothetical protein
MFQVYVPSFSSLSDVCCKYFHLDVAKVDLDVAYTCMLQMYFSSGFRCFKHLLEVFYLDVAYVCNGFQVFFGSTFDPLSTYVFLTMRTIEGKNQ